MGGERVWRRFALIRHVRFGELTDMMTTKRAIRLGPKWVAALMVVWGLAMIIPAALPH